MPLRACLLRPGDTSGGYLDDQDDDASVTRSALLAVAAVIIFFFTAICFYAFTNLFCASWRRRHHQDSNSAAASSVSAPADPGGSSPARPSTPNLSSLAGSFPLLSTSALWEQHMECVVCLNELEKGEVLRLLPACNHVFHPECIDTWMFSHTSCPLCRCSVLALPTDGNAKEGPSSSPLNVPSREENGDGLRAIAIAMDIAEEEETISSL